MALIYFVAFTSAAHQVRALVGSNGLLPAQAFLEATFEHFGFSGYYLFPTVFWFNSHDWFLQTASWVGAALSVLLFCNIAPALVALLLTVLYLSLTVIGQDFFNFQWDSLLIETGALAILVCPWKWWPGFVDLSVPSTFGIFLLRWLLFRFILLSGLVKLLSGDVTWLHCEALNFHFETQPLPTPLAPILHAWPTPVHQALCGLLLLVEIAVPFFIFGPCAMRRIAFVLLGTLQVFILLSGNHAFLNWLTLGISFCLLDDQWFAHWSPNILSLRLSREVPIPPERLPRVIALYGLGSLWWIISCIVSLQETLPAASALEWYQPLTTLARQWRMVNGYGLFSIMTTSRQEVIVEGSADGQTWLPYEFPYKPGNIQRGLAFVAPLQPRVDWQMWFAAQSGYERNPWVQSLLARLLQNSQPVKSLFSSNPFPTTPPAYVRALLYDYRFTTPEEQHATGAYWEREFVGSYSPTLSLVSTAPHPAVQ